MTISESPARRYVTAAAWLLVGGVLLLDLALPTAYAVRLLYIPVVLLALWTPDRWQALKLAIVATTLSLAHLWLGEGVTGVAELFRQSTNLHGMWVTAVGVTLHRRGTGQREQARRSLDQSLKELDDIKNALDQSAIVATTTVRGEITYVNDKFCEISKYSREELIGQDHRILNSGLHPAEFFKDMYRTIAGGKVWHGEIRNRAKDGSLYWVDTTIVPFVDHKGSPYRYIAIRYDITERKRSEAALRRQEALAQLGKMAAVVAHEVRNPLAGIRGAVEIIGRRLPPDGPESPIVSEIVARIDTLNDIVEDMLLFARPRPLSIAPLTLGDVISETTAFLHNDQRLSGVRLDTAIDEATILADGDQLKLVLLNLILNAAQAMQHRGTVRVTARQTADGCEIRIADTGPGIADDVRERLFEPFFTTKSRGTGLGLATARRIVEAHGGTIRLESRSEGGTVAIVQLPEKAGRSQAEERNVVTSARP